MDTLEKVSTYIVRYVMFPIAILLIVCVPIALVVCLSWKFDLPLYMQALMAGVILVFWGSIVRKILWG